MIKEERVVKIAKDQRTCKDILIALSLFSLSLILFLYADSMWITVASGILSIRRVKSKHYKLFEFKKAESHMTSCLTFAYAQESESSSKLLRNYR